VLKSAVSLDWKLIPTLVPLTTIPLGSPVGLKLALLFEPTAASYCV
jgi:hypothetical protein